MKKITKILFLLLSTSILLIGCNKDSKVTSDVTLCDYKKIDLTKNESNLSETDFVAQYLLDNSEVKNYSEEDVEQYITDVEKYYTEYAALLGMNFDEYLTNVMQQSKEDFSKEIKKSALEYIKIKDILYTIAEKEKLELTEKDYDDYLNSIIETTSYNSLEDFKNYIVSNNQEEEMKESAYFDKILKYVVELNKK